MTINEQRMQEEIDRLNKEVARLSCNRESSCSVSLSKDEASDLLYVLGFCEEVIWEKELECTKSSENWILGDSLTAQVMLLGKKQNDKITSGE